MTEPSNEQEPRVRRREVRPEILGKPKAEEPKEEKKVESVVTGRVITRKKGLGKRLAETFTGDDMTTVGSYIIFEVMVPAAKDMIADMFSEGIQRLLFGDSRRNRGYARDRRPGNSYTPYGAYYQPTTPPDRDRRPADISRRARATHDFGEIIIPDRGEAEAVLDHLGDLIEQYGVATVSDLYDLCGKSAEYTDDKWGWTTPAGMGVRRVREGFILELPRPIAID